MSVTAKKQENSNETVALLYKDFANLKTFVFYVSEESAFFMKLLSAKVYRSETPNLYEKLKKFITKVEKTKTEAENWNSALEEHKDQIRLLLGDQNRNPKDFYENEHIKLKEQVLAFINDSNNLKLDIFRFTGDLLLTE
ncbi:MAG TPA: hypothetical protein VFM70_11535 [Salinimicrobium sp.]|nr:hypothetical protein [Salinimicrobium sp.]